MAGLKTTTTAVLILYCLKIKTFAIRSASFNLIIDIILEQYSIVHICINHWVAATNFIKINLILEFFVVLSLQ